MAVLITQDDLKKSLSDFRVRGDMRWLKRDDAPELIRQVLGDEIDEAVAQSVQSVFGGLSLEELDEVLSEI